MLFVTGYKPSLPNNSKFTFKKVKRNKTDLNGLRPRKFLYYSLVSSIFNPHRCPEVSLSYLSFSFHLTVLIDKSRLMCVNS